MYIYSEQTMEDYLSNDKCFSEILGEAFGLEDVTLIGRQVHIGKHNICDLLYEGYDESEQKHTKTLIVAELKYRPLEEKDLAQLGRYISALIAYILSHETQEQKELNFDVRGALIGTALTENLGHIMNGYVLSTKDIRIMTINTNITYSDLTDNKFPNLIDISGQSDELLDFFCSSLIESAEDHE